MWFYANNGQSVGPLSEAALRQMFDQGQLPANTLVWREGMQQWSPAAQCGLVSGIPAPATPPGSPVSFAPPPPSGDTTGGLIPYKNPNALAGYYCGVGALIPCFGLILGPTALVLGIKGLKYNKENPIVKGVAHAWVAIVLGSLSCLVNWGTVILAIIGSLVGSSN